jgi:hypothetical protein
LQVNLQHNCDTFQNADKEFNNHYREDILWNNEGNKFIEFWERNIFGILSGKKLTLIVNTHLLSRLGNVILIML